MIYRFLYCFFRHPFQGNHLTSGSLFFHFLKEHPCIVIPEERVKPFIGLSLVMKDLYNDSDNSFRIQIFKNFIQNFILDFYDKTQHLFLQKKTEGINRQEEIFKRFIQLIHKHCTTQREVSFYAAELFITPRYLSTMSYKTYPATQPKALLTDM